VGEWPVFVWIDFALPVLFYQVFTPARESTAFRIVFVGAAEAKAHRPAYASDGDYFSKPNTEEIIQVINEMMAE
jgi:hypothetical protein